MRVTVHPAGEDACGFYRLTEPARVLADQGADVTVTRDLTFDAVHAGSHAVKLVAEPDMDVIVFQRPLHRWKTDLIRLLQQAGVAVVVEIDDDFGSIPRENPAWLVAHMEWMTVGQWDDATGGAPLPAERVESVNGIQWVRCPGVAAPTANAWLARACRMADLVTVTTPALGDRYAPHGRVAVLPNLVPESYLHVQPGSHEGTVVGWGGSVATHVGDLEVTGGGVAAAVEATGARFGVVGTGIRVQSALGLADPPEASGWVELGEWPTSLAGLDVGIVPLCESKFNAAKSWLKGLEMAAVGVPFVASPRVEYRRLHGLGAGVLAERPEDWEQAVRVLVDSPAAAADLAGRGREVAAGLTYEAHAGRWHDAWAQALDNRRVAAREKAAA